MRMIDDILAVIDDITPKEFLWLYVGVWAVLLMMGYFLAGGFYVFMTAIMLIVSIGVIYKYQKPPIVENNSVFLMPVFGLLYTGIFHSGLLFAPELIADKSQAQTLTAIVPNEHEYVQGSGKGAKSYYYLNMDGTRLHCDDDQYDDCENIYAYKGQKATVYHYDGLAYEIDVGGQKVYEFYAQANKFKATQHKKMTELVCAFILFGIPSVIFFFINKRVVRDIERVTANQDKPTHETYEDYKRNKQAQSTKRQHAKNIQSRIGAGGWAWRILFGCLAIFALLLLIFTLFGKYFISAGVFLLVMGGCYYLSRIPLKNAKAEVAEFEVLLMQASCRIIHLWVFIITWACFLGLLCMFFVCA